MLLAKFSTDFLWVHSSRSSPSRSRNITELAVSKSRRTMDRQTEIPSNNSTWSCLRSRHRSARNR